ncbi:MULTISPECIES: hypothetical protein [Burkholderia]|uniref:Uncharacterized protein n=1 Tax=Burkholderia gladioli TaxID=28095 RepID=A0A2A7SBV4_BURGA|nr:MULTISPECIES: hypothetical protein [Burkholderia]ATF89221.1 hypothetical protein CO712_30205 [Burkholderia gladioli pv. gladioli]MBJ9659395.1 hypothetical protein [Burkholderia gladioli]MBJ9715154.1 hypothetical protein [Burkholderia gladioli]MBU9153309.1 hypothetical protein [Burkholderia gladioli]MBU9167604.1 hypothetical protein [Burkholderia gladioli]
MKSYTPTTPDQRDRETRKKQRDALTRADIERAEQRLINDADIDSNASKWRYSPPDQQGK